MAKRDKWLRGIQFDNVSLQQADDLATRLGMSRSELVRWLVKQEHNKGDQPALPGFGVASAGTRGAR